MLFKAGFKRERRMRIEAGALSAYAEYAYWPRRRLQFERRAAVGVSLERLPFRHKKGPRLGTTYLTKA
jgi:hypothetical protein